jgi:hypothetical protein
MRLLISFVIWTSFDNAFATFDNYRVTDLGLPVGSRQPNSLIWGGLSENGTASARMYVKGTNSFIDHYKWSKSGGYQRIHLGQNYDTPFSGFASDFDWFALGNPASSDNAINCGYWKNGVYLEITPGVGYANTKLNGVSETRYIGGADIEKLGTDGIWTPFLYNVQTESKTYLPQLGQNTFVQTAFDDGTALVNSGAFDDPILLSCLLWKNGSYQYIGNWEGIAMSKTGYVVGGVAAVLPVSEVTIYRNGVTLGQVFKGNTQMLVTGVSDKGVVSTSGFFDPVGRPAQIASIADGAEYVNNLVVNRPLNMSIYGVTINGRGQMFGQAIVGGEHHYVWLEPVPEPGCFVVLGVGMVALLRRRRSSILSV